MNLAESIERRAEQFVSRYGAVREELGRVIVGHHDIVHGILTCLFVGGHCLLEGVPGLGKTLLVFIEITLASKSGEVFDRVRDELLHMPDVQECHLVSGSFDYLVKARLAGMDEYRSLLGDLLKKLPVAAQSHSYVVMEELKESLVLRTDR